MAYTPGKMTLRKEFVWNDSFWTPDGLGADLALWLDADDASTITLNGSLVSQWDDKSGNGRHVSQPTAAFQPVYTANFVNGRNALDFDGIEDVLESTFTVPNNHTVYYVARSDGQTSTGSLLRPVWSATGGDPTLVGSGATRDPTLQLDFFIFTTRVTPLNNSFLDNETVLAGSTYDGATLSAYKNGSTYGAPVTVPLSSFGFTTIGGQTDNFTRRFHGPIAEIVMADTTLSTADRQKLEGYLAWKWGLVANLPAGHPYKIKPPVK